MFQRNNSEGGRDLVPTTDFDSNSVAHSNVEPERSTLIDEIEPIFDDSATTNIDNHAAFSIAYDGEESYEAEEDMANTLMEVSRQRKKQHKKAAFRMLVIAAFFFVLVAITLSVFFAVRAKQQRAYNSSNNSNNNVPQQSATPVPQLDNQLPLLSSSSPVMTSSPVSTSSPTNLQFSSPVNTNSPTRSPSSSTYMPTSSNIASDIPVALDVDLTTICNLHTNSDMTKCVVECSKAKCCWDTNTCSDYQQCSSYSPCLILKNVTENSLGGCATILNDVYPPPFECHPIFLPCNTDNDCKAQMGNTSVYVNCATECSNANYPTPDDVNNMMNISDTVSEIGDVMHSIIANLTDNSSYYEYYFADDTPENLNDTIWNLITYDDFEKGWGNFVDAGSDSKLITIFDGNDESHVARIRHNQQESVLPLKAPKDVTQYKALRVSLWLTADGLETDDPLLLEYSPDGGSNWEPVKEWIYGKDLLENGTPYQFNVTFYSTDYEFSANALIRFRSDANSESDNFYIDNVEFEGAKVIDVNGNDVMAAQFFSFCGFRNKANSSIFKCNPASVSCTRDQDCYENFAATLQAATGKCGDDRDCVTNMENTITEYVYCLTECDQPTIVVKSQAWEIITHDTFESGYGNFVDKGSVSEIVTFSTSETSQPSYMVQLRDNKGPNSSLPLRDYCDVSKYRALRVSVQLVFQGIEAGDTLMVEYSPDPSSWVIVEEWVFGGAIINENNVPYTQEAIFYNSAYTNFTSKARIRFRSLANSENDHFLIGNITFSGQDDFQI